MTLHRYLLLLLTAVLLWPTAFAAQTADRGGPLLPVRVGLSLGVASPSPDYQSGCGYSHFVLRPEVRSRGDWFVSGAVDLFSTGWGTDIACIVNGIGFGNLSYTEGGLDLATAVIVSGGVGRRGTAGMFGWEGELRFGGIRGEPGYTENLPEPEARWLPWVGGSVGLDVFDHLWIAYERRWTRLPFRTELYPSAEPGGTPQSGKPPLLAESNHRWGGLGVLRIGLRL